MQFEDYNMLHSGYQLSRPRIVHLQPWWPSKLFSHSAIPLSLGYLYKRSGTQKSAHIMPSAMVSLTFEREHDSPGRTYLL